MTALAGLHEFVSVRGRFHRSVQLTKDWQGRSDLSGYLVTPTVRELITRIVWELEQPKGVRAWSITGPYGTGKSSFALFLSRLLAQQLTDHPQGAQLQDVFSARSAPFLPVLLVGKRATLKPALLTALAEAAHRIDAGLANAIREDLEQTAEGVTLSDDLVVRHFEAVAARAEELGHGGLIVIADEFGKFLEHTAQHLGSEDLLVMQSLAEAASRSATPFSLITILHTGFAEYLGTVDEVQRAEWQKVQGRFTDVAFQEPPEQLLRLLGEAVDTRFPIELGRAYQNEVLACAEAAALSETRSRLPLASLLPACAPLHPLTAVLLWPLFRGKLAQNERSLFSFLTSHEPFGFQNFLRRAPAEAQTGLPFYRLEWLYDYVKTSLGAGLYRGEAGRRWAELEDALDRIGAGAPAQATATLKSLGLLWLYGTSVGLRATEETIALAVGDEAGVKEALAYLEHASIVVYRRFEGAYGLWEGSDVDLEGRFEEARHSLGQGDLARRLKRAIDLRPIVARAHYIQTGTLRFFPVDVVDANDVKLSELADTHATYERRDGSIVYVLSARSGERDTLVEEALEVTSKLGQQARPVIFAFPHTLTGLEDAVADVESWRWVQENTPALNGDRVAKRELAVRLEHAQRHLEDIAGRVFGLRGYRFEPGAAAWVQSGQVHAPSDARTFLAWLSALCHMTYRAAPPLHNELLNRDSRSMPPHINRLAS